MKIFPSAMSVVLLTACTTLNGAHDLKTANANHARGCAADRHVLLAQDLETFDQSASGLRSVYHKAPECKLAAADLIAEYRALHPDVAGDLNSYLLFWHEGQLRAETGDYPSALPLLDRARMSSEFGPEVSTIWNAYVDATIAFVQRDRAALIAARRTLAAVPTRYLRGKHQVPNLDVVDALLECFEKSYADAYHTCNAARSKQPR